MKPALKLINIFTIFLLAGFPTFLSAQKPEASASLDSNHILIGDQVKYTFRFTFPSKATPVLPIILDTLTKNIEVISRSKIDTALSSDKKLTTFSQTLQIASFDSGSFAIPPMIFSYKMPGDTTNYSVGTMPVMLYVNTLAVDTTKEFKDIKLPLGEPITWREILPWALSGLGALLLIFIIIYVIRKIRKKEPIINLSTKPKIPPHEKALKELENLRITKLWQSGKIKEFQTQLTDVIRIYIEEQFDIDAMEMITYDLINSLKDIDISTEEIKRLEKILTLADMVKFAKFNPLADEHDNNLKNSVIFVENTVPKKIAEPEQNITIVNKPEELKSE